MEIDRYESNLMASNMYIIHENGRAIVIDPCENTTPADNLIIDKIVLTHEHYDHISGVNAWKGITSALVLCSKASSENICDSRKNLARHFKEFCELQTWMRLDSIPVFDPDYKCEADETFEDNMFFEWQGHDFYFFEIPGHSQGSIGILVDNRCFFSGDSLMPGLEIELRMPGGSRKKWESIGMPRIESLRKGISIYPGHLKEFVLR